MFDTDGCTESGGEITLGSPSINTTHATGVTTIQLAGALNVTVLNSFTLILNDDSDPVVGEFIGKAEGSEFNANGYFFRINYGAGDGNAVVLTTTVPEPGSAALLLAGLGLLGVQRRRVVR